MSNSLSRITEWRLINLRWLSVLAMLVAALVSPNILGSTELLSRLLALTTLVAAGNLCLHLAYALYRRSGDGPPLFSPLIQLGFDLTVWAIYIFMSGGATNPLISVFLPLVAIGATVLSPRQAWMLGMAAIIFYSILWRFYQPLLIADVQMATHLHLLGMWLVFVVSALVVIWFTVQMSKAVRLRDQALADAREKAIRNDWLISMGALAAGAAHELSTPLATLNILVDEWCADSSLAAALQADLALMRKQIAVCKVALTQLAQRADHSQGIETGRVMAAQWLKSLSGAWLALHPTATLVVRIAPALEETEIAFDLALEQAISNLLDNAVNAGAKLIDCSAMLCSDAANPELQLRIGDDGPGFSVAALAAFAAGTPILSAQGMGVGLLLVRAAIERLGGSLSLGQNGARGACATVCLPIANGSRAKHEH